jgi:Plasmid pRiA4b ORF-3-like protein
MPESPQTASSAERATAPARWLLNAAAEGIPLTNTHALARAVVRGAAERWPDWWDAELFGPPNREADLTVLSELHEGLKRLRLVRRRGRRLYSTKRGKELARKPAALLSLLGTDLGRGDAFTDAMAAAVIDLLETVEDASSDELCRAAHLAVVHEGWHSADGRPPEERDVGWVVGEVLRRGEAYGLFERRRDPALRGRLLGSRVALTGAGRLATAAEEQPPPGMRALVFDAELVNAAGVTARLGVGEGQHLTALHDAIQAAFGWGDDHLYSFWLDGEFWGNPSSEFTTPLTPDEGQATADVPLAELGLAADQRISYVFDFGDEWRVLLTFRGTEPATGSYPRVLERTGTAPSQYPCIDEE